MWNQVKVLQIGCGKLAKYSMKNVFDHGGSIVAALDNNPSLIGKDIGTVIDGGIKGPVIYNYDQIERVLKACNPEVAIIDTDLSLKEIKPIIEKCLLAGINIITNCEEAFIAEISNPRVFKEIDKLAKTNNCTIIGAGYMDYILGSLINLIASSTNKISKIKIILNNSILDKSIEYMRKNGIGFLEKDFSYIQRNDNKSYDEVIQLINNEGYNFTNLLLSIFWLSKKLSLNITSFSQKFTPIVSKEDLVIKEKGINLPKGYVIGLKKEVIATSKEGISFEFINEETISNGNLFSGIFIEGEPSSSININNIDINMISASNIVNRIPSVIDSNPGFLNTTKLEESYHLVGSIEKYIDPSKRKK